MSQYIFWCKMSSFNSILKWAKEAKSLLEKGTAESLAGVKTNLSMIVSQATEEVEKDKQVLNIVEVKINPERIVKMTISPRDLFVIITVLRESGYDPQVRVMNKEDNGWTCWQPTSIEKVEISGKKK